MDAELKAKWVEALRGGKYQQCNGSLKELDYEDKPTFCCLGVLRDLVHPRSKLSDESEEVLHARHLKEFGLTGDQQTQLAWMNDGHNGKAIRPHSFAEIAKWIEKNL